MPRGNVRYLALIEKRHPNKNRKKLCSGSNHKNKLDLSTRKKTVKLLANGIFFFFLP